MKLAIVVGHNSASQGAVRQDTGGSEFVWNGRLAVALPWAAPASDGGHPVLGYLVERNTGSWVSVATQGSPTGYTKQYIRSMTGLAAGTYRVSAITKRGTGTASGSVTVT